MNMILWVLSGAMIGALVASFFGRSDLIIIGDFLSGLIGSLMFGNIAKRFVPNLDPKDLHQQSFSLSSLLWATAGAIILIAIFNAVF
jgi:uncharacterized membrane protein YeaQ/YmgE (transglycosylase-associated protein family)